MRHRRGVVRLAHQRDLPYGYVLSESGLVPDESEHAALVRLCLWREAGHRYHLLEWVLDQMSVWTLAQPQTKP